jgi:methylated-DNA-protein-cysteine methyltransferase-like protein
MGRPDDIRRLNRRLLKARPSEARDAAMRRIILQIPRGKVATYGQVAAAAGYPFYHRQVVQLLRKSGDALPWQRVVGAGGYIRLKYGMAHEQRVRLSAFAASTSPWKTISTSSGRGNGNLDNSV